MSNRRVWCLPVDQSIFVAVYCIPECGGVERHTFGSFLYCSGERSKGILVDVDMAREAKDPRGREVVDSLNILLKIR